MMKFLVSLWRNNVVTTFLAGLVVLLPVVLTILIVAWIVDFLRGQLGPGSFLGDILLRGGATITGPGYDTLAFLLGALIALVGIWCLGVIARSEAQEGVSRIIDRIFTKLPIIRAIYNPVSRVVRLTTDKGTDFSGMSVVACRFEGIGTDVLALLANHEVYLIGGERRRMVYLPAAPIPMSGGLLLVAESAIVPVPEMKVEDLLRVYFSLGALAPDSMPATLKTGIHQARLAPPPTPVPAPAPSKIVLPQGAAE
jgi:uncharacterized membrane protein